MTAIPGDALVAAGVLDLRGVGSTFDLPNIEPPTSFQFNGVYIPREGTSVGFFDLAQLELLPGPQGTLYGRSSLGGAVRVTFNRPTRELSTAGVLEAGNYSLIHGTLVQNVPLADTLAVRAAVD